MKLQVKKNTKLYSLPNTKPQIEQEIKVFKDNLFYIKINIDEKIDYVNLHFAETSGFEEYELIDKPLYSLFHPDMPKVILSVLKERLEKKKAMQIIQKYVAKNGCYFWLASTYSPKLTERGMIASYTCKSTSIASNATEEILGLYHILSKIESKTNDTEAAKKFLIGYLEAKNITYDSFIKSLCDSPRTNEKQSHETRDFILKEIDNQKGIIKNKQQVSYSKNKKVLSVKHNFKFEENILEKRA